MRYAITNQRFRIFPAVVLFGVLLLAAPLVNAQQQQAESTNVDVDSAQVATNDSAPMKTEKAPPRVTPAFSDYKGITIGMSAEEVRQKLDRLREKGDKQDFFVFSDAETAQVYYDTDKKVSAISVDYLRDNSGAPAAETVLGKAVTPRNDGSMYELVRYPEAGYWVSYNRTAGDNPTVTVTMQKIQ